MTASIITFPWLFCVRLWENGWTGQCYSSEDRKCFFLLLFWRILYGFVILRFSFFVTIVFIFNNTSAKVPHLPIIIPFSLYPIWSQYPNWLLLLMFQTLWYVFEKVMFQCIGDTEKQFDVNIVFAQYLMHVCAGGVDFCGQISNSRLFAFQHCAYHLSNM